VGEGWALERREWQQDPLAKGSFFLSLVEREASAI